MVVEDPRMVPTSAAGGHSRLGIGAFIGAVFGLIFIEANSGDLSGAWVLVTRAAGAVVFIVLFVGIRRVRKAPAAAVPAASAPAAPDEGLVFGRGYWLIAAAEVAALAAGLLIINTVFGAHALTIAWIAVVVGVHFFGLGVLWRAGVFHVLGASLTALGIAGFVVYAAGGSAGAVALVSGIASGIVLYLATARFVYSTSRLPVTGDKPSA